MASRTHTRRGFQARLLNHTWCVCVRVWVLVATAPAASAECPIILQFPPIPLYNNTDLIEQPINFETLTPRYTSTVLDILNRVAPGAPAGVPGALYAGGISPNRDAAGGLPRVAPPLLPEPVTVMAAAADAVLCRELHTDCGPRATPEPTIFPPPRVRAACMRMCAHA